jgi:uncharacterized protein (DUF1499 family)
MTRILALVFGGLVLAAVFGVAYVRSVEGDPDRWHIDPRNAERTGRPNEFLVVPAENGGGDMASPVFDMSAETLAERVGDVIATEPRAHRLAGDLSDGFVTYVVRSRWVGFPDYVSILIQPVGEEQSTISIWSRARFGYSDWGVNEARVRRWLEALQS